MSKTLFYFFIVVVLFSCSKGNKENINKTIRENCRLNKTSIADSLNEYFQEHTIKPHIIVNNIIRDNKSQQILVGRNILYWKRSEDGIVLSINGDKIPFKDAKCKNDTTDNLLFCDAWDNISQYEFDKTQLLVVTLYNEHCCGNGCGVKMYIVYNLRTKAKSFFSDYRYYEENKVFDLKRDGILDFISVHENFNFTQKAFIYNYKLYSINKMGEFEQTNDSNGKPYFIDFFSYDSLPEKLEANWIEAIK